MTRKEMIRHRKSCRSFTNVPVGEELRASIRFFRTEVQSPAGYDDIGSVML